jgi:hypothetical protein
MTTEDGMPREDDESEAKKKEGMLRIPPSGSFPPRV